MIDERLRKRLISFMTLLIACIGISWYWIFIEYWWHFFGIIGYFLMGWWWRRE